MRTFASDNYSNVHPDVMHYLAAISQTGHAPSYGDDSITDQAEKEFVEAFGENTQVLFVPTGTGANILGLKLLLDQPYGAVMAADQSHMFLSETGAVAANLGAQMLPLPQHNGKISLAAVERQVSLCRGEGYHAALPKVLSITNPTECGTIYWPQEIRTLADFCHDNKMYLHVDGSRLANAAAALETSLGALTRDVGVDVLSFGGSKNGLAFAESVVILNAPPSDPRRMQKQCLQLVSKLRFASGQFVPYLRDELWRQNAIIANDLAALLASGLRETLGDEVITRPVETNQVFARLPDEVTRRIRSSGHTIYGWTGPGEARLVASWDNTKDDVRKLVQLTRS